MALFSWVTFPLISGAGIIVFLCLLATAVLGVLILKGKTTIPLSWHTGLATLTVVVALIHAFCAMAWSFGW